MGRPSKLSAKEKKLIALLYKEIGHTQVMLARRFNLSQSNISRFLGGTDETDRER
jgi:DNA-binding MarR family transcriptional regulator